MIFRELERLRTRRLNHGAAQQPMPWIWFVIFIIGFGKTAVLNGQPARDARIVLTAGGPTASVRTLEFSSDSRRLYAAGADKTVDIWSISETKSNSPDLKLVSQARWPIARHDRGQIWALAVNDAKNLIAFGGYGAQQINGDISIADSVHGRQLTILPPPLPNQDPQDRFKTGHLNTITSMSFSPNGERLASISLDGEVRLWSSATWSSIQVLAMGENPSFSDVFIQFISDTQFVASLNPAAEKEHPVGQLRLFTIESNGNVASQILVSQHTTLITALANDPKSGRWFSGDALGEISLWQGRQSLSLVKPHRAIPVRKISTSRNGVVLTLHSPTMAAIAAGKNEFAYAELKRFTPAETTLVERREWNVNGETLAAAISADGKYAAMTRPGEAALEVFNLVDPKNDQVRPNPFTAHRPTVIAGSGATVQRVQFVREPASLLAISTNTTGEWTHGFNLATAEVVRPNVLGVVKPAHPSPDWNVEVGPSFEGLDQTVTIQAKGVERAQISLTHQKHGHYAAHGWIFEKDKTEPSAVAIGTLRQNGIFLFDLREPGTAPLLRYYRDHTNAVNSLSQSADGRYLASSSQDQTVRIWSLDGLLTRPESFEKSAAWGGEFRLRDNQLIVTSLLESGILRGRRLQEADQIVMIALSQDGGRVEFTDPQQMLKALKSLPLTESVEIHAARADANVPPLIVTPAWEPMSTLFIDRRNEWAAWTPSGYYNSSVDGDELFGFQINPSRRGDEPRFSRAEQLREQYERPELLQKLFALNSMSDALKAVALVPTNPGSVVAQLPMVQINNPVSGSGFPSGSTITVSADVDFRGVPEKEFRLEAWLNGAKLSNPVTRMNEGIGRYAWTVSPPPGEYQFLVKIVSAGPTLASGLYSDATVPFTVRGEPDIRTVHVLAIGANNYQGALKMNFCIGDAKDFVKLIEASAGPHYRLGKVKIIVDEALKDVGQFEKAAFQAELAQFAKEIKTTQLKSNDIVMIYLAGLGEVVGKEFYFVPPLGEIKNLAQLAVVQRYSIPWAAFRNLIEDIPNCGKVFFLDTCYAGSIARLESEKARLRPLKNLNTVVFAATSEDHLTREDELGQHGRFTAFLLDGLGGSADGSSVDPALAGMPPSEPDGKVSLLETVGYVSRRVIEKWRTQQPRYTPVSLIRFLNDPIIDVLRVTESQNGK